MSNNKSFVINGPLSAQSARITENVSRLQDLINNMSFSGNSALMEAAKELQDDIQISLNTTFSEIKRLSNKAERASKSPKRQSKNPSSKTPNTKNKKPSSKAPSAKNKKPNTKKPNPKSDSSQSKAA